MIAVAEWLSRRIHDGAQVIVPAIVYYELKRELLRAQKTAGIARLDAFVAAHPGRYLVLTDQALRLAAELWARARQQGRPTAGAAALDVDVLIAAQVLTFAGSSEVVVATTNPKHLAQFIPATDWNKIS